MQDTYSQMTIASSKLDDPPGIHSSVGDQPFIPILWDIPTVGDYPAYNANSLHLLPIYWDSNSPQQQIEHMLDPVVGPEPQTLE